MKNNKPYDEIGSWKRTEMQLRDKKAHSFAMLFKDNPLDLGKLAFNLLAGNLRFVVPEAIKAVGNVPVLETVFRSS